MRRPCTVRGSPRGGGVASVWCPPAVPLPPPTPWPLHSPTAARARPSPHPPARQRRRRPSESEGGRPAGEPSLVSDTLLRGRVGGGGSTGRASQGVAARASPTPLPQTARLNAPAAVGLRTYCGRAPVGSTPIAWDTHDRPGCRASRLPSEDAALAPQSTPRGGSSRQAPSLSRGAVVMRVTRWLPCRVPPRGVDPNEAALLGRAGGTITVQPGVAALPY